MIGAAFVTMSPSSNSSNRRAILHDVFDIRLEESPVPEPSDGELLIKVDTVGICGSDVHYYTHGKIGNYIVEAPLVLGHEASGIVCGAADDAGLGRVGERVAIEPGVPCGHCTQCRLGRYNLCNFVKFFATPPVDGAFCQYVTVDADFAHTLPENVTLEEGAMVEPSAVAVAALRKAGVKTGDSVLVTGAGTIGILCAQVARASGATDVHVADISERRLRHAQRFGLATINDEATERHVFDVVVECSGSQGAVDQWFPTIAPHGRVVLVGMGHEKVSFDLNVLQNREISVQGIFRYANCYPTAINLIRAGLVNVKDLVTHRFPLADAAQALTTAKDAQDALKVLVMPNSLPER